MIKHDAVDAEEQRNGAEKMNKDNHYNYIY